MSELISGKEALIALANGEEVEINNSAHGWIPVAGCTMTINSFLIGMHELRLKPRTITINAEIEKPKEIVLCAITGAVGLVYGDIDKARSAKEKLEVAFNAN